MVTTEYDGHYVSGEYPTFECDPQFVRPEFLSAYFKASSVWREVAVGSKGLGNRRQRVQPPQVLSHSVWVPPLSWQDRLAKVQAEVDALKGLQAETAAELDALLPAVLDRAFKGEL
jgi:type I restriction enzyme, S subunit